MNTNNSQRGKTDVRTRDRVSTALLLTLGAIAFIVLIGLAVIAIKLTDVQNQISDLRDHTLQRVIKLSQLSQGASASIAIAPAMSTNPSRFEFETLLSRIEDKRGSQLALLAELGNLIRDEESADALKRNSELLAENQTDLSSVVRQQIDVRKRLENHIDTLRKISSEAGDQQNSSVQRQLLLAAARLQAVLLDTNRARFSKNRREIAKEIQ